MTISAITCVGFAVLLLQAMSVQGQLSRAQPQRDDRGNIQIDPDADNTVPCGIPAYQDPDNYFQPQEGFCSSLSSAPSLDTIDENYLHQLAVAYAPVVFFHPLEKYTLSAVNYTLSNDNSTTGRIYRQTKEDVDPYLVNNNLNTTFLLQTTRDPIYALNPASFYFETDQAKEMYWSDLDSRFGDGYDSATGISKAPLYYNVYETGNGTWTFNYWLYFPYNGEGGMGVLSTYQGKNRYTRFTMKPYGIHEGDWEGINVMVCQPPPGDESTIVFNVNPPLAVKYHQHEWSELLDCTQGECKFYKDSFHPVGFTALNSHATYSESVAEMVYTEIEIGFYVSLQAFVVVDRTVYKKEDGSYNYYFPTQHNLERFQEPNTLGENSQFNWQGYGGRWGVSADTDVDPEYPNCLNDKQTGYQPCPTPEEDPVFDFAMVVMAVSPPKKKVADVIQAVTSQLADAFSTISKGPLGPGSKGFWERWSPPHNCPFWALQSNISLTSLDYCNDRIYNIDDSYREPIEEADATFKEEITTIIVFSAVMTFFNMVVPLAITSCQGRKPYQPILFNGNVPQDPTDRPGGQYMAGALIFSLLYVLLCVSGITFIASCQKLFQVLDDYIPSFNWTAANHLLEGLGGCIILMNTLLLFFLWLQVWEMRKMIQGTYLKLLEHETQTDESTEEKQRLAFLGDKHYVAWNPSLVDGLFQCSFAFLFLSLLFSLVCFLVGMYARL